MAKKEDKITMIPPVAAAVNEADPVDEGTDEGEDDEWDDEEGEGDDTVILVDAEGTEREFVFLAVVDMEEEGQFAALTPADEDESSENTEVFLFHYEEDEDGAESFTPIEDEDLFARVQAAAEEMFKQMEHDDGEDGHEHGEACDHGHAHDHGHDKE